MSSNEISSETKERAEAYKYYLEQSYANLFKNLRQRAERRQQFQKTMEQKKLNPTQQEHYLKRLYKSESEHVRLRRFRFSKGTNADMFQTVVGDTSSHGIVPSTGFGRPWAAGPQH